MKFDDLKLHPFLLKAVKDDLKFCMLKVVESELQIFHCYFNHV